MAAVVLGAGGSSSSLSQFRECVPQGAILGGRPRTKVGPGGDENTGCRWTATPQQTALALQTVEWFTLAFCKAVNATGSLLVVRPTCKRLRVPRMLVVVAHGWRFYFGRRRLGSSALVGLLGTLSHLHHRDAAHLPFQPPAPSLPGGSGSDGRLRFLLPRLQVTDRITLHTARQFTPQSACDGE